MVKPKFSLRITAAASPAVGSLLGICQEEDHHLLGISAKVLHMQLSTEKQQILNISRWKKPLNIVKPIMPGDGQP